jgi:hypothetical protein
MLASMRTPWLRQILRRPSRSELVWAAIPVVFVLVVLLFFPFRFRIEFDADEGINAIKAMMVLRGYHLYSQIWSDRPPVFTVLLASWLRWSRPTSHAGRLMVLFFPSH